MPRIYKELNKEIANVVHDHLARDVIGRAYNYTKGNKDSAVILHSFAMNTIYSLLIDGKIMLRKES